MKETGYYVDGAEKKGEPAPGSSPSPPPRSPLPRTITYIHSDGVGTETGNVKENHSRGQHWGAPKWL